MFGNLRSNFCKKGQGWSINLEAPLKKKKSLLLEFDIIYVLFEKNLLSDGDIQRMKGIKEELWEIWKIEETGISQRCRDRKIKEGDRNTAYFCVVANQRRMKNHLYVLVGEDGHVYTT